MNKEINTPVIIGAVVALILVVIVIGWFSLGGGFGGGSQQITPEQMKAIKSKHEAD